MTDKTPKQPATARFQAAALSGPPIVAQIFRAAVRCKVDERLIEIWWDTVERYGVDSGPARGALLALVRTAWGDLSIIVRSLFFNSWQATNTIGLPRFNDVRTQPSELQALVMALEHCPSREGWVIASDPLVETWVVGSHGCAVTLRSLPLRTGEEWPVTIIALDLHTLTVRDDARNALEQVIARNMWEIQRRDQ